MKIKCKHLDSYDLDTYCRECKKSYIPHIPSLFLITVALIVLIYFWRPLALMDMLMLFAFIFLYSYFYGILRFRGFELLVTTLTVFPVLFIFSEAYFLNLTETARYVILLITYTSIFLTSSMTILYGFVDSKENKITSIDSFILIILTSLSILVGLLYFSLPEIIKLTPWEDIKLELSAINDVVISLYNFRLGFVVTLVFLLLSSAIVKAFIWGWKGKFEPYVEQDFSEENQEKKNLDVDIIRLEFMRFIALFKHLIRSFFHYLFQFFKYVRDDIMRVLKDALEISFYIIVRISRLILMICLSYVLYISINGLIGYTVQLWTDLRFYAIDWQDYLLFLIFFVLLVLTMILTSLMSAKKWSDISIVSFKIKKKNSDETKRTDENQKQKIIQNLLGKPEIIYKSITSIFTSTTQHMFFYLMAFFSTWLLLFTFNLIFKQIFSAGVLSALALILGVILAFKDELFKFLKTKKDDKNNKMNAKYQ